ncbi:hypothetical protein K474DRAFT_651777 [Panus rudis PR-1116 ss-1]|nr:hypothetical protein K474DRAFT_651777 [Panus rudis PR-1116 ss-1]
MDPQDEAPLRPNFSQVLDTSNVAKGMQLRSDRQEVLCKLQDNRNAHYQRNYQLNARSPINTLPAEVLSLIFLEYKNSFDSDQSENYTMIQSQLLSITFVCRHWRSVALGCANLWNNIEIGRSTRWDYTLLFLRLFKQTPLSICIKPCRHVPIARGLVVQNMYRIQTYREEVDRRFHEPPLLPEDVRAPVLQKLSLEGFPEMPDLGLMHLPLLRHFSASFTRVNLASFIGFLPNFSNITDLQLQYIRCERNSHNENSLHGLFANLPKLRRLVWDHGFRIYEDVPVPQSRVFLPLEHLVIEDTADWIAALLGTLDVPSTVTMRIHISKSR